MNSSATKTRRLWCTGDRLLGFPFSIIARATAVLLVFLCSKVSAGSLYCRLAMAFREFSIRLCVRFCTGLVYTSISFRADSCMRISSCREYIGFVFHMYQYINTHSCTTHRWYHGVCDGCGCSTSRALDPAAPSTLVSCHVRQDASRALIICPH